MNIYKISQEKNNNYDTYDSAIVIAETGEEAIKFHPHGQYDYEEKPVTEDKAWTPHEADVPYGTWVRKEFVQVELIGEANDNQEKGVILASFNAG